MGEVIKIRFSLKVDESVRDAVQLPKLILLYGRKVDKSPLYRMFFPDVDTNFIGFENASSEKKKRYQVTCCDHWIFQTLKRLRLSIL